MKSTLLVELPQTISHIVQKRGRVLRDGSCKGISVRLKGRNSSWLETSVTAKSELPWDAAHNLAAKLKKEFGVSVYVEPESLPGLFHELTTHNFDRHDAWFSGPLAVLTQNKQPNQGPACFLGSNTGLSNPGQDTGVHLNIGDPLTSIMPQNQSPLDFLPQQARNAIGMCDRYTTELQMSLDFPPLASAQGFQNLSESIQKMFEVEAAQLMNNVSQSHIGLNETADYSALSVLAMQLGISKTLRTFLERATLNIADIERKQATE